MNASARNLTAAGPRFSKTRPAIWLALDMETGEALTWRSEDEAYAFWRDEARDMDYRQMDGDGCWFSLNDDFEGRLASETADARAMRRHEAGLTAAGRYL